jgi:hypothetical protein
MACSMGLQYCGCAPEEDHTAPENTMIAAIYARKSTDENGVADEEKSVTRQVEHGRTDAARKG